MHLPRHNDLPGHEHRRTPGHPVASEVVWFLRSQNEKQGETERIIRVNGRERSNRYVVSSWRGVH